MDIYCPLCAEPWDMETLHDAAAEQGTSYQEVAAAFRVRGCNAIGWSPCNPDTVGTLRAQAASVMFDLLGDDMDGVGAMLDDFEWAGLLD